MMQGMPSMRERLDAGQLVLCMALAQARTADIPMMAAASGFDAVYVDLEHSATSLETTSVLCAGAIGAGITPLVRVPAPDHQYLTRALDIGAMGVIVPHVETRAEAEQIVDACRFPPRGHRSVAGPNPANRYQSMPQRELLDAFDEQTVVAVMLETPAAVERADAIAAVPGVDMVMLGPHDLTAEMGILGQFRDDGVPRRGAHRGEGVPHPRPDLRHRRHPRPRPPHRVRRARACASSAPAPTSAS